MALSPTAAWYDAMSRADARVVALVKIYDGTNTWSAVTGSMDSTSALAGTEVGVQKVAPVGVKLDPVTRSVSMAEMFIDFVDAWLRPILVNNRLDKQRITVTFGAAELDESDFIAWFQGPIEEILPVDQHTITVSVLDPFAVLGRTSIVGYWINKHPLECLYAGDGTGILELANVNSINTASFNPNTATYTDDISHLIVSRVDAQVATVASLQDPNGEDVYGLRSQTVDRGSLNEPTPALAVAQGLARLINGHLTVDETGAMKFVRFNASASAVDAWTTDDIIDGSFKQQALGNNIINRVIIRFGRAIAGESGNFMQAYQADETVSQSTYAYPGESERVLSIEFDTNWCDSVGWLDWADGDLAAAGDDVSMRGPGCHSITGNRADAWGAISNDRPLYLMLDSSASPGLGNIEIIRAKALTRETLSFGGVNVWNPNTEAYVNESGWVTHLTMANANVSRAQLNTSASIHKSSEDKCWVRDITPLVILADELLQRFKNGCPIIELETTMAKYEYQIGDLVTLDVPQYVNYGDDGTDTSDKWEIVGKEADPFANPPVVKWTLASAVVGAATITGKGQFAKLTTQQATAVESAEKGTKTGFVKGGCELSSVAGLSGRIASGTTSNGSKVGLNGSNFDRTYTASKDTYVSQDLHTGEFLFDEVNNAATAPRIPDTNVFIGKVVAGVAAITSVDISEKYQGGVGSYQTLPDSMGRNHNFDVNMYSRGASYEPDGWSIV